MYGCMYACMYACMHGCMHVERERERDRQREREIYIHAEWTLFPCSTTLGLALMFTRKATHGVGLRSTTSLSTTIWPYPWEPCFQSMLHTITEESGCLRSLCTTDVVESGSIFRWKKIAPNLNLVISLLPSPGCVDVKSMRRHHFHTLWGLARTKPLRSTIILSRRKSKVRGWER